MAQVRNWHLMFLHSKNRFFKLGISTRKFLLVFTLVFFIFSNLGKSEVYEIYGIAFDVNNVTQVSETIFKVEDDSGISFFNKFELENYLINKKFANLSDFENPELKNFFKKVLKDKRIELGAEALKVLSQNHNIDISLLNQMIESLENSENYLEFVKAFSTKDFESIKANALVANVASYIFLKDPNFLRRKSPTIFYSNLDRLKKNALQNFYTALIEYDVRDLKELNGVLRENFSLEDEQIKNALILYDKCGFNERKVDLINYKKDLSHVFDYYEIIRQDVELSSNKNLALKERYVNKIHLIIAEALSNKEYNTAAHFFSLIPLEWRTPTTHEHALKTIQNIEKNSLVLIGERKAVSLFTSLAKNDFEIKYALESKLEAALKWFLSAKKFGEANVILEYLKKIHPKSEVKYLDKIYISFAKNYLINSERYKAKHYLSKVEGFIGIKNFLWFLVNSYYFPFYLIIAFLGLIFLFIIIRCLEFKKKPKLVKEQSRFFKFFQKIRMRGYGYGLRQKHEKDYKGLLKENRRFAQNTSSMKDPRVIEYERLLANLGINKNSSLQAIKESYRRQVKLVHPDVSKSRDDSKRFVELTKVYDRLIELYDELYD